MRKRRSKSENVFVELLSQTQKTISIIMPNKNDTANVVNFDHQKYSKFELSTDTNPKYINGDNIDVRYLSSRQKTKLIVSTLANKLAIEYNWRLIMGAINAALLLVNIWPYVFSLLLIINNYDTALANNGEINSGTGFNRKINSAGLKLNNFIPHFEPLYYDRHRFLHQYTRLKRNIVEQRKQQTKQPNENSKTNELNDETSINSDANNKTKSVINHSNTVDINIDDYHNNNYQNNRDDHHYHPAPGPNDSQRDQKMIPDSKTSSIDSNNNNVNNSSMIMVTSASTTTTSTMTTAMINFTATTIAFLRHNCPLPTIYDSYYYHHDHIHNIAEESFHKHYQIDRQEMIGPNFDTSKEYDKEFNGQNLEIDSDQELNHDYPKKIRLEFSSHNRKFNLVLQSQSETVFAPDVVFESTKRNKFVYDMTNVIIGHLEDDEDSIFMGIITQDGLLDGHLQTRHNEYYIEPASRYFDLANEQHDFHSVIYHSADVNFPSNATHGAVSLNRFSGYDSIVQYIPLNPFRFSASTSHWYFGYDNPWTIGNNDNGNQHFIYKRSKRSITINGKSATTTTSKSNGSGSSTTTATNSINNKSSDTNNKIPIEHYRKLKNKAIISNGQRQHNYNSNNKNHGIYWRDMDSLHYTESEPYGIKAVHPRTHWIDDQRHHDRHVVVDPKKTTCMLYLQADHLFYEKMGSEEACIESMTRHVQKVNNIYKNTDFDQDGRPDNISFLIKRIKVHTMDALNDPEYRYPSTYGVEKFLELFSEEDYDAFCLAYMFTYRDFEGGTLGLAWTGDLKNAGGVCEKNGHYRGSLKSLNTGIVTLLNYGKHVPPIVSHVTLAHEIGHNFGSPHDPEDDHACTPGGENGNYIMFARATSGDKRNNNKFSPCSLRSINAVLNTKAKSLKGCFQEPQDAICGNEVVEDGEECDCGWEEDCKEPCCFPMRANSPPDEPPCRLRPNVICSPSQGPCCTQDCKLKVGNKCRDDNGCRTASYCNGQGPQCPPSTNKANKTICNEEYVCYMGECTGSICMAYGLESCQCKQGPNDSPAKLCELCCRMPSDDSTCKSSFEWNTSPYDVPDLYAKPGTPCDNYNGYCDVNQRCREVDPSSPLATLRRLLLSNESMASLKRWFNEQWFYVAVLVLITVLILLMAYKVFNSRRSLRLTKTDIMEVALEAVAKHQQEQQAQQAQQAQQQAQQQQQIQQQSSSQNNSDNATTISTINQSSTKSSSSTTTTLTNNLSSTNAVNSSTTSSSYSISSSSTTKTTSTNHLQSIGTTTSAAIVSNTSSISSPTNLTTIAPPPNVTSRNSIDSNAQSGLLDNGTNANYASNKYCTPITQTESTYSSSSTSTPVVTFNIPTSNASSVKSLDSSSISNSKSYLLSSSSDVNTKQLASNTNSNSNNIYGTNSKINSANSGHNHNHSKTSQHDVYYSKHSTLYHHPFASGTAHQQMVNSLYGYTSDVHHPTAQGIGSNSQSTGHQSQQHHHSIPSLYHPSNMIYSQNQPAILQQHNSAAQQSYYDTAAAGSLAIVGHQAQHPNYSHTHYGSNNNPTAYEQIYGQHYYGYRSSHLSNYGTTGGTNYYQPATASTTLYDYLPYSGNSNHQGTKPPPLPSMATHPSLQYNHHHGTIGSATLKPSTLNKDVKNSADGFSSRRSFYSAKDSVGIYGIGNSALNKSSTNITNSNGNTNNGTHNNNNNNHFYYYSSLSSNYDNPSSTATASSAAKFAQHYGTMLTNHNHNHHSKSSVPLTGNTGGSNHSHSSRHYQHYYPMHNHGMAVLGGINDHHQFHQTRAHHSSHPQLLDTQSFSLPTRPAAVAAASPASNHLTSANNLVAANNEPIYHSGVYRRHTTDIYEPLATLPLTSISHFGYSLEHASAGHGSDSIYYSARSDHISGFPNGGHPALQSTGASAAQHNLGLQSQSLHRLHHSNSFHGHLDALDFLDSNGTADANADAGFSTASTTISRNSHDRNSPRLITRNADRDRDLDQGTSKSESGLSNKQMKHSGSSGWV